MRYISHRITIINVRKPSLPSINEQLQWLATSLGLFSLRDRNKTCFRIFIDLLKSAKHRRALTSDEIADHLSMSRGTVIHHINHLIDSGIVVRDGSTYMLRVDSLSDLIDEVEKDIQRTLHDLREVARSIDSRLD
ncbi:winged helix-turn-helix transcriptional regulator [Candidatus Woesearchaeota archaeon]|nr:winged helix-turn-helix transcriptional regulator [Candidatus Woesearchaeota archaeon]